ncbi:hypothetical protein W909_03520 [Dickeya zeae EC1]|nr:hypothetical protein W909_03520 [Dickeya zeae EC1]
MIGVSLVGDHRKLLNAVFVMQYSSTLIIAHGGQGAGWFLLAVSVGEYRKIMKCIIFADGSGSRLYILTR